MHTMLSAVHFPLLMHTMLPAAQAEYERERIDWSYIQFVDNQDVLDLIEGRMGVLDLLDEQCRFPTATHKARHSFSHPLIVTANHCTSLCAGGVD